MAEECVNASTAAVTSPPVVSFTAMKAQVVVPAAKAEEAVKFYAEAFGAEEVSRSTYRKRKGGDAEAAAAALLCAEVKIGSTAFLVCDQNDGSQVWTGVVFRLETSDVNGAISKAVKAGAIQEGEVTEEEGVCGVGIFGKLKDPFGTSWIIASAAAAAAKKSCCCDAPAA